MAKTAARPAEKAAVVSSGTDGEYRMVIDKKYSHMANMRRWVAWTYPVWFTLALGKLAWIAIPFIAENAVPAMNMAGACFAGLAVVAHVCWLVAALKTRDENFIFVMVFNVALVVLLAYHIVSRAVYYLGTGEFAPAIAESDVVASSLIMLMPRLSVSGEELRLYLSVVQRVLDGGVVVVGLAVCVPLHFYILEKKAHRKKGLKKSE